MKRMMLATVAVAALTVPVMAQSQHPMQQPPEAMPQQQKMQSQRDWLPEHEAARPPTHQGEQQKFGAGQSGTVGQAASDPQSSTATPLPETQLKAPAKETDKTDQDHNSHK